MNRIRTIRVDVLGYSQKQLAEIAGVAQATVSRWENGVDTPTLAQAAQIAQAIRARGLRFDERAFFDDGVLAWVVGGPPDSVPPPPDETPADPPAPLAAAPAGGADLLVEPAE
jgi:transcriptional regulator with XRE-family HTH domain